MENLTRRIAKVSDKSDRYALFLVLSSIYERLRSVTHNTAGLAIKAGGGVLVKTGAAACNFSAGGSLGTIAAATDMPALVGTVSNAAFNVFVFSVDSAGNTLTTMGTEGAALANVKFPAIADDQAILGYITINPTGTGDFVGGTTALDDATVVPNAVYVNTVGAVSPVAPIV